jgi:hypothetical protein
MGTAGSHTDAQNPGTPIWASPRSPATRTVRYPSRGVRARTRPRPPTRVHHESHLGTPHQLRLELRHCGRIMQRRAQPAGLPLIQWARFDRPDDRHRAAEPGYLSHSDATAAPVDRLPQRQTLILSHRSRRACPARPSASRTRASRSPSAVSTAIARASSRRSRSARSLCSTAWASNAERRARLPHRVLTHHISPIATGPLSTPAFHSVLSRSENSSGHHRRSQPASRTPSRLQIPCATHLSASSVRTPILADRRVDPVCLQWV